MWKIHAMLIRIVLENVYSFGERKEFNMLPLPRYRRLNDHKYALDSFSLLKQAAIYGANGAGKSNLIKSLALIKSIALNGDLPISLFKTCFKLQEEATQKTQIFCIEFIQRKTPLYYALAIKESVIIKEELYRSGLGKKADHLIFERTTNEKGKTSVSFLGDFEADPEGKVLKGIIEKNLSHPKRSLLALLASLNNEHLTLTKTALEWFKDSLQIIMPDSTPSALSHRIDNELNFKQYAEDIMRSFHLGITHLKADRKNIKEFYSEKDRRELHILTRELERAPNNLLSIRTNSGNEITVVKEGEEIIAKRLMLVHQGDNEINATFELEEESDGTIRLLDFIPAFHAATNNAKVIVIDEMERSIHPLVAKELIRKFSMDSKTKGQLIFTTHESNLLDQTIFRQDEIWFAEKNKGGSTDLYSLSDFKEHNTTDIRKGYLNGRYGAVPFLANLQDLNWHAYDFEE